MALAVLAIVLVPLVFAMPAAAKAEKGTFWGTWTPADFDFPIDRIWSPGHPDAG